MCDSNAPATTFPARAHAQQLRKVEHLREARKRIEEWPESAARSAAIELLREEEETILPGVIYALEHLARSQQQTRRGIG